MEKCSLNVKVELKAQTTQRNHCASNETKETKTWGENNLKKTCVNGTDIRALATEWGSNGKVAMGCGTTLERDSESQDVKRSDDEESNGSFKRYTR